MMIFRLPRFFLCSATQLGLQSALQCFRKKALSIAMTLNAQGVLLSYISAPPALP